MKKSFYSRLRQIICPFDKIIAVIPENKNLLDLGSGYGTFCFLLNEKKKMKKILGIEKDENRVLKISKNLNNTIGFVSGDVTELDINEKFDVVTCIDLFHHVPGKYHKNVLVKIKSLLKKNGIIIIKDMDTRPFYKYSWNYLHDIIMTKSLGMNYIPKERFVSLLKSAGFKVIFVRDISNPLYAHYLIKAGI